tara:strand:- start:1652 stop:2359 length:708 start_codon:yes stop_codon:yes gene_type:complete
VPETKNNNSIAFSSGSIFNIEFYLENSDDLEDIEFISSGIKYTDKIFSKLNSIDIISGFRNQEGLLEGDLTVKRVDKPNDGSEYFCDYSFGAPVDGERVTVNYTLNRLLIDASRSIESVRTITSDVLIKEAEAIVVDCSITIVISEDLTESKNIVIENVQNQITNVLNLSQLGGSVSMSDVVSAASSVSGVEGASVKIFCESGENTSTSFIKALDNQTISPGNIEVTSVSRRNFS